MKYIIVISLLIIGIVISSLPYGSPALRKLTSAVRSYRVRTVARSLNSVTSRYWQGERIRKVFVDSENAAQLQELRATNEVIKEVDYGSFRLLILSQSNNVSASEETIGLAEIDGRNLLALNDLAIDTSKPQELPADIPHSLRQTNMTDAILWQMRPQGGLFLVQFIGPVKDEWLKDLASAGVEICSYVGDYSYVVKADDEYAPNLITLLKDHDYFQFVGDYEPALRLRSSLREKIRQTEKALAMISAGRERVMEDELVKVIIQVLDGKDSDITIAQLQTLSLEPVTVNKSLQYHNVSGAVPTSRLALIASMNAVFAIEEQSQIATQDERQVQILTRKQGQTLKPGYVDWLKTKGFPLSAPKSGSAIVVNVVDDCPTLEHGDIKNKAFEQNPAKRSLIQSGHGFMNAHIIAADNINSSRDEDGYLFGIGIAPFVKVGVTAILNDNDELYDNNYEDWDNQQDSEKNSVRISNNSWGSVINTYNTKYDTRALAYDKLAFKNKKNNGRTYVFAAGNYADADQDGLAEGSTISSPAIAKNVITVGASEGYRPDDVISCGLRSDADNANDIADFSGRGHSRSMQPPDCVNKEVRKIVRIKPDLVAPGTRIVAGVPAKQSYYENLFGCDQYYPREPNQIAYTWSSGTSHAAPVVSGAAALLLHKYSTISPVLIKAWLMNSATRLSGSNTKDRCTDRSDLTSNTQGMGRLNLERALDSTPRAYNDLGTVLTQGQTYTVTGKVAQNGVPLRVTLAWMDPPGATTSENHLVNNLDLEVTANNKTYIGNLFNLDLSIDATTKSIRDSQNNVESVYLNLPKDTSFTIRVRAISINKDGVDGSSDTRRQDFALMIYNVASVSGRNIVKTVVSSIPSVTRRRPGTNLSPLTILNPVNNDCPVQLPVTPLIHVKHSYKETAKYKIDHLRNDHTSNERSRLYIGQRGFHG